LNASPNQEKSKITGNDRNEKIPKFFKVLSEKSAEKDIPKTTGSDINAKPIHPEFNRYKNINGRKLTNNKINPEALNFAMVSFFSIKKTGIIIESSKIK